MGLERLTWMLPFFNEDGGGGSGDGDAGDGGDGDGGGDGGEAGGKSKDGDGSGVPDQYSIALPDGSAATEEDLKAWTPVFKELGLTQEKAQRLATVNYERIAAAQKESEKRDAEWAATREEWKKAVQADPDVGGDKFQPLMDKANVLMDKLLGEEQAKSLREFLTGTAIMEHPQMVRFLGKIVSGIGEGGLGGSNNPGGGPKSEQELLREMYPSMFDKQGNPKT